jgi:hypothetical protein
VTVVDAIDTHLATYPESPIILDLFGTHDADAIRARALELDPDAEEVFFFAASVGALFGVRRRDGSRVAMKLHKLYDDERFLDDMQAVQGAVADAGFPAPRPLGRRGLVTWEEWVDDGSFRDAHEPAVRRALASTLARFVALASSTGVWPRRPFFPLGDERLWPKPHNALFDFEASAEGAEWIDEIARAAKAVRDSAGRDVVGHTDWAVKHFRFDDQLRPLVLYDWDSLDTQSETRIAGSAMASFTYTEELEVESLWPAPEESIAFLAEYEEARGTPFTVAEQQAARGAAVYLGAYVARCSWAYARVDQREPLELLASALL